MPFFPSICHLPLVPAELDPIQEEVGPSEEIISFHSLNCRNEDHEDTPGTVKLILTLRDGVGLNSNARIT